MRRYVPARENQLQIDLDQVGLTEFHKRLAVVEGTGEVTVVDVTQVPSKTVGHWHITVMLKDELPLTERLFLQVCLGSDPMRELLSWSRARRHDPVPVLFIEPQVPSFDYDGPDDLFDFDSDDPADADVPFDRLACGCEMSVGRCVHMDAFQPAKVLRDFYGK